MREPGDGDLPPPYRELVEALGYLVSGMRPDLAHAVRNLSKYLACFDHRHFALGKYVLRYLMAMTDFGLVRDIGEGSTVNLLLYTYAHFANDPVD